MGPTALRDGTAITAGELRLGGAAGSAATLLIIGFATINVVVGGLFSEEALAGESIAPWIERIQARPGLSQVGVSLPILGFALLFVFGLTLCRLLPRGDWRRNAGLTGYLLGAPVAIYVFVSGASLVSIVVGAGSGGLVEALIPVIRVDLTLFMWVNFAVGPWLLIIVGHGSMAWCAFRSGALPRGLCGWAFVNAALLAVGTLSVVWPGLSFAQIAAPSSMLWMGSTGVHLLRSAGPGTEATAPE